MKGFHMISHVSSENGDNTLPKMSRHRDSPAAGDSEDRPLWEMNRIWIGPAWIGLQKYVLVWNIRPKCSR
jgi:hypothetical protein